MVFTKETAKISGQKGGKVHSSVAEKLGPLETVTDAKRWLGLIGLWGCQGRFGSGSIASAANRSVEVWLKALEADHTRELIMLRNRVKELEKQLKKSRVAY